MKSGIYLIKNLINGKVYIGSSKHITRRITTHKNHLLKNKHHSIKLQRAYNKYGIQNFEYSIIQYCKPIDNIINEQYWLDYLDSYKNGYNCLHKAGSNLGFKMKDETKLKLSIANKGKHNSPNTEFKKGTIPWSKDKKGIHLSPKSEFKKGQIGYWKGKKRIFSLEQKMKTAKPIIIDNIEYYGIKEASRQLNIKDNVIMYRLKSVNFTNYNYKC